MECIPIFYEKIKEDSLKNDYIFRVNFICLIIKYIKKYLILFVPPIIQPINSLYIWISSIKISLSIHD